MNFPPIRYTSRQSRTGRREKAIREGADDEENLNIRQSYDETRWEGEANIFNKPRRLATTATAVAIV